MSRFNIKTLPHLGNRDKDSLIRRDVSGGRDGAPLSPGVGHNLKTERGFLRVYSEHLSAQSSSSFLLRTTLVCW